MVNPYDALNNADDPQQSAKQRLIDALNGASSLEGATASAGGYGNYGLSGGSPAGLDISPSKSEMPAGGEPGGFTGNVNSGGGSILPPIAGLPGASPNNTAPPLGSPKSGGNNVDTFLGLLNSGKYSNPQDAIDAFNGMGLDADNSGLSSHYGSSPAFYANGAGQIGLPDRYLVKQPDGTWQTTMRSQSGGGDGAASGGGLASMLGGDATGNVNNALNSLGALGNSSFLQQLLAQLRGTNGPGVS